MAESVLRFHLRAVTKEQAVDKLVSLWQAPALRDFFAREVENLVGKGRINEQLWEQLLDYFNHYT